MRAIYITSDELNPNSGAGIVCLHEINALKSVVNNLTVFSRKDVIGAAKYDFNPFLYDYFAARMLPRPDGVWDSDSSYELVGGDKPIDLLHLSCSPGVAILDTVRPKHYVTNIVAHDLAVSIEEHERYYGKGTYPFKHNTDPYLHEILLKHAEGADTILTPSTGSERWIRANIKNPRVTVIPHGTEIPETTQPLPTSLQVGYLGAFGPDKGLLYLLMGWSHFTGGELLFGGSHCPYIKQLAIQIDPNLRNQVYLGWVNKVSDFYNQVSVYIQPSVSEGFGIEIIEAMAHGRPVIATTGTAGPDAITDGVEGFIVPPRDPGALLDRLVFFRDNPGKIAEMGARAREKAKDFSWEKVEQKYVNFYKGILGGG